MSKPIMLTAAPGSSRANKTGSWRVNMPVFKHKDCTDCRICVLVCPDACVSGKDHIYNANMDYCKGCGLCAYECPVDDIDMVLEAK